ncbi:hypothetical protein FOQG_17758 [Fusarium oxysporum f. sp. raphani 54005]|uniref:Uncharacterized protein n=4 Tax=Fusarium oxysporum TaxID=5507 RepID=X0BFB9_FUSOX|nr:hypothetical protein FOXB_04997 [Fusarium oxysporum f. sp. conglutinans Fo5176]EXK77538.1 hypothetical protein FOQG_17758 [Fusarium oxysporum f. sp. raphani 54005]EXL64940.1 hypothetical protein FOPG_18815 [Fusarium oxysporum f. sp. conglutinans race 2 54008]KAG6979987.1 hypothetical protein FocnCong_v010554 [Fusarium oxysporum f. sp. conglutinans]KAG7418654.1 hypothetical protein Forpi1262_v016534 [Fusarium oxysporum f. sp. raphani]KAI8402097.1 hypothetical protein FOFC_17402 [Fusarium oxy
MATGLEALGAASAVLQVIAFASDLAVACKDAYDGATTPLEGLQRHAKEMAEAVDRVYTRCDDMVRSNSKFSAPELQNIAAKCRDAAKKLETEVQYVTSMQAKGNIAKSFHKAFRISRHRTKIQDLEESLSKHQRLMELELTSHLCTRSDAISLQQEAGFRKLEVDVQSLIEQLAKDQINMANLLKEHATTRNVITQETAKAEGTINAHTDTRILELRTNVESEATCKKFLQSLKAPRMNQRYNDVMDPRDASFNQVFASYGEDDSDTEQDEDSEGDESSDISSSSNYTRHIDEIHRSWASFSSWLQSDDILFYIQGKPGSGKSTLVKFILDQEQTLKLVQQWSHYATIVSYFFWKIGSHEQNSIKGLWCSLLYQRLQDQQKLIQNTLEHFKHLSLHTEYHDWSIKDLEAVWGHVANIDSRHLCIFIDGLDEIRNDDGFSKLAQSIQLISKLPRTKLCVSTRPEAQIMRWLKTTSASGILLEDLTKFDMLVFVRKKFRPLLLNENLSSEAFNELRQKLVYKSQGVFLWLHLATRSIIEGIENGDAEDMLLERLSGLPQDLEKLYIDMWQRLNTNNPVYRETAARYFHYVIQRSDTSVAYISDSETQFADLPMTFQIACSENPKIQQTLLQGRGIVEVVDVLRMCNETRASIHIRCAGLIEAHPKKLHRRTSECLGGQSSSFSEAFGTVAFIHRTAHDFLTDTEAGQNILGYGTLLDSTLETRLLKGLICMVLVSQSKWGITWHMSVIYKVIRFLMRWGSEALPSIIEILDVIRPLYDKHAIIHEFPSMPQPPFFSFLTNNKLFDDFIIARLRTENSTLLVTSVLRYGWDPDSGKAKPSKRLFDALMALEANPHEYGETLRCLMGAPFVRKGTAFTNLLMSFFKSTQRGLGPEEEQQPEMGEDELCSETTCEMLEMAVRMAKDCQDLTATVALPACFLKNGRMRILPLSELFYNGGLWTSDRYDFVIYEVNVQFLLLYLLSKVRGNLARAVLADPQAQGLLSKANNPSVKIRYSRVSEITEEMVEDNFSLSVKWKRIAPQAHSLPISVIEHIFNVNFKGHPKEMDVYYEDQADHDIIAQHIKDLETEDVNHETMVTSLANETLGFCTFEEAGISRPAGHLRHQRVLGLGKWHLSPLRIGRLEVAAASKE